ncbi:MAG: hypothetical protein KDD82_22295 [Planctomycetes bacterium]|nr:hypothetical protein [Planctomycetota bacterium]
MIVRKLSLPLCLTCSALLASGASTATAQETNTQLYERYRAVVEAARGLRFKRAVPSAVLTPQKLQALRDADLARPREPEAPGPPEGPDPTEVAWKSLGLIPRVTKLAEAEEQDLKQSEGGFYLTDDGFAPFRKGTLVVIQRKRDDPTEVSAHELLHALHDQHFDLDAVRGGVPKTASGAPVFDATLADDAVEEGIATLIGGEIANRLANRPPEPPRDSPFAAKTWIAAKADFPYAAGAEFARAVRAAGGLSKLDALYRDPPRSSEQILHPERYLRKNRDLPSQVSVADPSTKLPGAWETLDVNTLGELGLGWLAGPRAAAGWDGDQYRVLRNTSTGQVLTVWALTFDTAADAAEARLALPLGPLLQGLPRDKRLAVRQRGRELFVVTGATEDQLEPALAALSASRVRKLPGDDDRWPPRKPPRDALARALEHAHSGTTVVRRGATRRAPGVRAGSFVLDPEGRELAEKALRGFEAQARRKRGGVKRLGAGRYALPEGTVVAYRDGVLRLSNRGTSKPLDALLARLESKAPPAPRPPTAGVVEALGRSSK